MRPPDPPFRLPRKVVVGLGLVGVLAAGIVVAARTGSAPYVECRVTTHQHGENGS
jgi:hypothetical protein